METVHLLQIYKKKSTAFIIDLGETMETYFDDRGYPVEVFSALHLLQRKASSHISRIWGPLFSHALERELGR